MKFNVVACDPPWEFSDKLSMSDVKRGAEANYSILNLQAIKELKVPEITVDDAILALWVPSSILADGLDVMKAWGFRQTQTFIWVKTKKVIEIVTDLAEVLAFGMGRLFRNTHEICLVGVKGKIYSKLQNKSQRTVCFAPNLKHSAKPEALQDMLDKMFPGADNKKLEMFARRDREGWSCIGNECPSSFGEDIRDSIERLKNENE